MKNVLLDTNLIIAAYDPKATTAPEKRQAALKLLGELLDGDAKLYVSPLIRYEVLRGSDHKDDEHYQKLKEILDGFPMAEITTDVSDLAAHLFRFDRQSPEDQRVLGKNPEKYRFDVFHYACAHCNGWTLETHDADGKKIGQLHTRYQDSLGI